MNSVEKYAFIHRGGEDCVPFSKWAIFVVPLSQTLAVLYIASVLLSIHSHIHKVVTATTLSVGMGVGGTYSLGEASTHLCLHTEDTMSAAMYVFRIRRGALMKRSQKPISFGFITDSAISMRAGVMHQRGSHQLYKRHTLICCMIITFSFCLNIIVRIINTQCVFVTTPMISNCC